MQDRTMSLAEREALRIFEVGDGLASGSNHPYPRCLSLIVLHEHGIEDSIIAPLLEMSIEEVGVVRQEALKSVCSDPGAYQHLILLRHEVDKVHAPALLAENDRAWDEMCRYTRMRQRALLQAGVAGPRRTPHRAGRSKTRGAARRASDRSGSSGDDDDPDDEHEGSPPPDDGRRFCAYRECRRDISHKAATAKYCGNTCNQNEFRARKRDLVVDTDRLGATVRWFATLRTKALIRDAERAVAEGRIDRDRGTALARYLIRARLESLGHPHGPLGIADWSGLEFGGCSHQVVTLDEDGDAACVKCGHLTGDIADRINGYDTTARSMAANGTGVAT